jgi:hypothetical protein
VLGGFNYGDGQWLGYHKNEASCYLYFDNTVHVGNVLLNMLENTGAMIFPPAAIEVWGGMDKRHLRLLGKISPLMPVRDTTLLLQEKVELATAAVKCLKIIARPVPRSPIKPLSAPKAPKEAKAKPAKPVKPESGWVFISELVLN